MLFWHSCLFYIQPLVPPYKQRPGKYQARSIFLTNTQLGGTRVRRQSFAVRQYGSGSPEHTGTLGGALDQAGALLEIIDAQRRRETRGA